ncbi:MAG: hypothetical protein ACTSWW_05765 [Promethearchaeota archaeon]
MNLIKSKKLFSTLFLILVASQFLLHQTPDLQIRGDAENKIQPHSSEGEQFIEVDRYTNTTQLIDDPLFNDPAMTSPWTSTKSGDISDMDGTIDGQRADYTIIGNQSTFSEVHSNFTRAEWTDSLNPEFNIYPDSHDITAKGFEVSHIWMEDAEQSPCAQIEKDITMPVNMSDYVITSASVEAVANATVTANDTRTNSNYGVDVIGDDPNHYATYDYAYFYVKIADLSQNKKYEIAYNQTIDLGKDSAGFTDYMFDTYFSNITETLLIQFLTSVLNSDDFNFKIILGIRIWSEDNWAHDEDFWDSLVIKNFSLTFTYEKKIDQGSTLSWSQTGFKIDTSIYPENSTIQIDTAILNWDYNISQSWPAISPNAEIRVYIDDIPFPETIKLSDVTVSLQQVKGGSGFDVANLISLDQNISIKFEIYLGDTFPLGSNITYTMDNLDLTVNYTIAEREQAIQTNFQVVGSTNREILWNETFVIQLNYSEVVSGDGVMDANFTIDWDDNHTVDDIGNGIYNITCITTNLTTNQRYFVDVSTLVSGTLYLPQDLYIEVNIIGRPTGMELYINGENKTESPIIETTAQDIVNISAFYYETIQLEYLTKANVSLIGSEDTHFSYELEQKGDMYEILLDTELLGIGTHFLSLYLEETHYFEGYAKIRIDIVARDSITSIKMDGINTTRHKFPIMEVVNITVSYVDTISLNDLYPESVILSGINETAYSVVYNGKLTQILLNTTTVGVNIHYIAVVAEIHNYDITSNLVIVEVVPRETFLDVNVNGINSSLATELNFPITELANISIIFKDTMLGTPILMGDINLTGISSSAYIVVQTDTKTEFLIDTESLGVGIYFLSITGVKQEYISVVTQYQLNVNRIHTNITTPSGNQTFTIFPGEDFNLNILVENLDFGGLVEDCQVTYAGRLGSGDINETTSGNYAINFPAIPEGVYTVYVTVYKENQYFEFATYEITLNVIEIEEQGLPQWLLYVFIFVAGALSISFVAYQRYYKYPKIIRDLHQVKKALKHGNSTTKAFKTSADLFGESYGQILSEDLPRSKQFTRAKVIGKEGIQSAITPTDEKPSPAPTPEKAEKVEEKQEVTPDPAPTDEE